MLYELKGVFLNPETPSLVFNIVFQLNMLLVQNADDTHLSRVLFYIVGVALLNPAIINPGAPF